MQGEEMAPRAWQCAGCRVRKWLLGNGLTKWLLVQDRYVAHYCKVRKLLLTQDRQDPRIQNARLSRRRPKYETMMGSVDYTHTQFIYARRLTR
jgi:hypothetical protein